MAKFQTRSQKSKSKILYEKTKCYNLFQYLWFVQICRSISPTNHKGSLYYSQLPQSSSYGSLLAMFYISGMELRQILCLCRLSRKSNLYTYMHNHKNKNDFRRVTNSFDGTKMSQLKQCCCMCVFEFACMYVCVCGCCVCFCLY